MAVRELKGGSNVMVFVVAMTVGLGIIVIALWLAGVFDLLAGLM